MLKNQNKAFFIFYFVFGLIVFLPSSAHTNQNAAGDSAAVPGVSFPQADTSIPTVPPEPVHISELLGVLPARSDIPAPIGLSKQSQTEAKQRKDQQTGDADE